MSLHTGDGYHFLGYEESQERNPHASGYSIQTIQIEEGYEGTCQARWEGPERYLTWHIIQAGTYTPTAAHLIRREANGGRGYEPCVGHEIPGLRSLNTFIYHTDELFPPSNGMLFRGRRMEDNVLAWYRLVESGLVYIGECDALWDGNGPGALIIL